METWRRRKIKESCKWRYSTIQKRIKDKETLFVQQEKFNLT